METSYYFPSVGNWSFLCGGQVTIDLTSTETSAMILSDLHPFIENSLRLAFDDEE